MIELKDLNTTVFTSYGAAWQWAVDIAALPPAWISQTAGEIGLSELSLIEIYKKLLDQGKTAEEIKTELAAQAAQIVEAEKEDYSRITT